jgi:alkylation response protein AidB-like acyl-CoA dehydrogenase
MPNLLIDSRDVRYVLFEMLDVDKCKQYKKFADHDHELYEDTLKLAEKISVEQFYPANVEGDRVGVRYDRSHGAVSVPTCFKAPYRAMSEAGFIGVSAEPSFGGLGLPLSISVACKEYFCAANGCLTFYALLTGSAAQLVHSFGNEEQKRIYLSKMLSGEWGGTMCLTEPEAGSEVGNVKTKAVRQENGTYLITGQKIFISGGEHDLTGNIIHMVLARIQGDPPGTRGLSLFIVPKHIPEADGTPGKRNDLACVGVEEKMGIHGLSTCALAFGENNLCIGYLLGAERKGMRQMFQMMNEERLFVGLQGLSFSSAAYMHATAYAKTRFQGTHVTRMLDPHAPQVPIIEHPDVRRMLLWMKSYIEGMRMLTYFLGKNLDVAALDQGENVREAQSLTELLIPLCKAGNTDTAWLVTAEAIQVYGGYGYCQDYPVEQYARECKILSIVEGTNGIQSIDLLMRKILMDPDENNMKIFRKMIGQTLNLAQGNVDVKYITPIVKGLAALDEVLKALHGQMGAGKILAIFTNATPFQKAMFLLSLGWMHLWSLSLATSALHRLTGIGVTDCTCEAIQNNPEALFYYGKILSARFFIGTEFPKFFSYVEAIINDEQAVMAAEAGVFTGMP